jgi:protein TonB
MTGTMTVPGPLPGPSANERLKQSFGTRFWRSLALATLLHFLILAYAPQMQSIGLSSSAEPMRLVDVPAEIVIPPPPAEIARPAVPILSSNPTIAENITIDPGTFRDNPVSSLPPPPLPRMNGSDGPSFTPHEVKPELRNRLEFGRALERSYPPRLREAGIGGTVMLWVRIDESGTVQDTRVVTSSDHDQLDRVAQDLIREAARFSPALNRGQTVAVWIQLPVTFQAR